MTYTIEKSVRRTPQAQNPNHKKICTRYVEEFSYSPHVSSVAQKSPLRRRSTSYLTGHRIERLLANLRCGVLAFYASCPVCELHLAGSRARAGLVNSAGRTANGCANAVRSNFIEKPRNHQ